MSHCSYVVHAEESIASILHFVIAKSGKSGLAGAKLVVEKIQILYLSKFNPLKILICFLKHI